MKKTIKSITTIAFTLAGTTLLTASVAGAEEMMHKPTYRFYDDNVGAHFFTTNKEERDIVIANDPRWTEENKTFEVVGYSGGKCEMEGAKEVYRFYRPSTMTHFYTQNKAERDEIIKTDLSWNYEQVAYCAYSTDMENTVPVYRFYREATGSHFFTANEGEMNYLKEKDKSWRFEGTAYYAMPLNNIIGELKAAGNFTTLLTAVEAAGLTNTLQTTGKYTLFAPNDEAFAKLESENPGTIAALLADKEKLKNVLLYHVLGMEVVGYEAMDLTTAQTLLSGKSINLSVVLGALKINSTAKVLKADIHAENGVIHEIDEVLMYETSTVTPTPTVTPTSTPTVTPTMTTTPTVTVTPV